MFGTRPTRLNGLTILPAAGDNGRYLRNRRNQRRQQGPCIAWVPHPAVRAGRYYLVAPLGLDSHDGGEEAIFEQGVCPPGVSGQGQREDLCWQAEGTRPAEPRIQSGGQGDTNKAQDDERGQKPVPGVVVLVVCKAA